MSSKLLSVTVLLVCVLWASPAAAFGAGEVPATSEFNGYVWRHGDIAEVLRYLPASFVTLHRFTKLQRKQIYFGNWLRDFSQVIDTTCLENVPEPILRAIIALMAFLEFGFATDEFEVTRDRLGCYRHEEHIDNPKGYASNAKDIDPRLRGPLDPKELEIDPMTGMKNYIAKRDQGWPTAAEYIRTQLEKSIELGRKKDAASRKESFIHLGAALHTLEDFSAHSNYTELCLRELGEKEVFAFVGDACRIEVPHHKGKMVPPIITGTFGMLDIFHSLLGEADDMAILQAHGSLGELENKLNLGSTAFDQLYNLVKNAIEALSHLSSEGSPLLEQLEGLRMIVSKSEETSKGGITQSVEEQVDADWLWKAIEPAFYFHDRMAKWLQEGEEKSEDIQSAESKTKLGEYSNQLLFKFLSVMVQASVQELRNAVKAARSKVDDEAATSESAEVYKEGSASDPSHSDISKDHFANVLNQPAGLISTVTTNWVTQQVVDSWDKPQRDMEQTINEILSILHHPAFPQEKTAIQQYMFDTVKGWWADNSPDEQERIRSKLTKESVKAREHEDHKLTLQDFKDKRKGPGKFPGSRPKILPPPVRRIAPVSWALNEAITDVLWLAETLKKGLSDPRGAIGDLASGATSATVQATSSAYYAITWAPRKLAQFVTGMFSAH